MSFVGRKSLKTIPDVNKLRERRLENVNRSRKQRRDEELSKLRNIGQDDIDDISEDVEMIDINNNDSPISIQAETVNLIYSNYSIDQLAAARRIFKMISKEASRSVDVIAVGLFSRFFELLQNHKNEKLQVNKLI